MIIMLAIIYKLIKNNSTIIILKNRRMLHVIPYIHSAESFFHTYQWLSSPRFEVEVLYVQTMSEKFSPDQFPPGEFPPGSGLGLGLG